MLLIKLGVLLIELDLGDPLAQRSPQLGAIAAAVNFAAGRLIELDLDDQLAALAARSGGVPTARSAKGFGKSDWQTKSRRKLAQLTEHAWEIITSEKHRACTKLKSVTLDGI